MGQSVTIEEVYTSCSDLHFLLDVSGDITQKGYEKKRAKLLAPYKSASKRTSGENFSAI